MSDGLSSSPVFCQYNQSIGIPAGDNSNMTDPWCDTLYVWDGIVEVNDEDGENKKEISLKWEGTWVPCENCADAKKAEAPKRVGTARDVESANHFAVNGSAKPMESMTEEGSTAKPHEGSLTLGQGWDMAEGDEIKKYKDSVHQVLLSNIRWMGNVRDQRDNLVFAKGKNDFGHFISTGWMRPGCRLTLARRYLDDKDARVKWDLKELHDNVVGGIFDGKSGKMHIPPWQCDAMHSEYQQSGKRKQVKATEVQGD
jgi:hypothetical protein